MNGFLEDFQEVTAAVAVFACALEGVLEGEECELAVVDGHVVNADESGASVAVDRRVEG